MEIGTFLAILGAALAAGMSGVGSGIGIYHAARVASGVLSEAPEKFGTMVALSILPGTQGMYGFVVTFIVMFKLGMVGGAPMDITIEQGLRILFACLPIVIAGFGTAIYQGKVTASGVALVAKRSEEFGHAITLAILVEFYALLGLVASFLMVWFAF
jgi:V/A-type H+-transporting ATPase subunit K